MRSGGGGAARVEDIAIAGGSASAVIAVGDERHTVSYRATGADLDGGADAFFVAALPIAMRRADALALDGGVSPALVAGAERAQQILAQWDHRLHPVDIEVSARDKDGVQDGRGTGAFFTGGVDSFYTVLRRRDELDGLIHVHGFDLALDERRKREHVSAELRRVASELDLPLIEVETDLRETSNRHVGWRRIYTGPALASVALLLGQSFRRVLIPATHSYRDLHPTGTHPLVDPLWSTERVEIRHVDAVSRVEKLRELARSDLAMGSLRICFAEGEEGLNCGRCPKCLRTMAGLRIVGALELCRTLPDELPLRRVSSVPITHDDALTYARENLAAAEADGSDEALIRALRRLNRRGTKRIARRERRAAAEDWARAALRPLRRLRAPSRN